MESFSVHTIESAPDASRRALQGLNQILGRIPNLAATMAESPVVQEIRIECFSARRRDGARRSRP
jgi:hypothetical protein